MISDPQALNLLHVVVSLDPVYGGQAEAVKQLILALSDQGHRNEVLTLERYEYSFQGNVEINIHQLERSSGKYHYNPQLIPWLKQNAQRFDAVICHGIWQFQSYATWIASKQAHFPYFIYVHGALDPWFKHTYPLKHFKKMLYWPWAEYQVLKAATAVLFTSEGEREGASKSFSLYKANEVVVNAGISNPSGKPERLRSVFFSKYPQLSEKKILLFMGRIHPIKACDDLIKAFAEFARQDDSLHLVMAGPDVIGWSSTLKDLSRELGVADRITWTGMLENDVKWGAYYAASCLLLPSHTENFGIVVAEALACSTPVLISNKVNIWHNVAKENAGLIAEDTLEGLVSSLKIWIELPQEKMNEMRINARNCFEKYFEINHNVTQLAIAIQRELERGKENQRKNN